MKNPKCSLIYLFVAALLASCTNDNPVESNNTNTPETGMTLHKRVIFNTHSEFPTSNTKQIQYYQNNEVVADSTFNNLNQWISRKITITNGTTKTHQTLDTNNNIIEHREVTYDNQGRITSRRTYVPENLIIVSFVYNANNTITATATNYLDGTTSEIAVYHKNFDGLIYKEVRNNTLGNPGVTQGTIQFVGTKAVSLMYSGSPMVTLFDYYSNPVPDNLLKSSDEINNNVLSGLSLTKLAETGNHYYKKENVSNGSHSATYQTDFNSSNYIQYYKSTYLGNGSSNQLQTEIFYYYN